MAQLVLFAGLPFWLQSQGVDTYGFPAVGPSLGWLLAFTAMVSAARAPRARSSGASPSRRSASICRRHRRSRSSTSPNSSRCTARRSEIFVLFSDLEGFTKLSHALEPEMVATLLNRYLDMLSQVVLDHGGMIDKFVGDAVVAFWGAPIAQPDDGQRAARAGYALWQAGEEFRARRRSGAAAGRHDARRDAFRRGDRRQFRRRDAASSTPRSATA